MALISLSDWLDRFGDTESQPVAPAALDSLRFETREDVVEERRRPAPRASDAGRRAAQAWRRIFWRWKRQPGGAA
jgi:hypothetical protein